MLQRRQANPRISAQFMAAPDPDFELSYCGLKWTNPSYGITTNCLCGKLHLVLMFFHGIYCSLTFILYINDWFKRFFVTREFLELSGRGGVFCYEWRCILSMYFNDDEKIQRGNIMAKCIKVEFFATLNSSFGAILAHCWASWNTKVT